MDPVRISWPGGEHLFALPLGRLRALQTSCNAGPEELFNRLRSGAWRIDDLIEILRHGLIGGGMDDAEAGPMVVRLMEVHAPVEFKMAAYMVLSHGILGPEDDSAGKPKGRPPAPESGDSAGSTETAP